MEKIPPIRSLLTGIACAGVMLLAAAAPIIGGQQSWAAEQIPEWTKDLRVKVYNLVQRAVEKVGERPGMRVDSWLAAIRAVARE